jgi:hypothetical protein
MLLVLAAPSAACAQTAISDLPDSSIISDISPVPSHQRYQLMSDLGGQQLFFSGVRTTSRLFATPQLFIGGNLDLKPLAIYSLNRPNGTEYTYGGGGSIGLQCRATQPWFDGVMFYVSYTDRNFVPHVHKHFS